MCINSTNAQQLHLQPLDLQQLHKDVGPSMQTSCQWREESSRTTNSCKTWASSAVFLQLKQQLHCHVNCNEQPCSHWCSCSLPRSLAFLISLPGISVPDLDSRSMLMCSTLQHVNTAIQGTDCASLNFQQLFRVLNTNALHHLPPHCRRY